MKPFGEQTHYEILELPRDAGREDIEQGYRLALSIYDGGAALYSIFDEDDAAEIRARIEKAYRVLSDPDARLAYDAELAVEVPPEPGAPRRRAPEAAPSAAPGTLDTPQLEPDPEAGSDDFDGPRLRRSRLRRGIEIEQIANITKINPTYLRFIEEERFEDLPASVYVRGFVKALSRCVGLDPDAAAASYMKRCDAARGGGGSRWLRGRG